MLRPLGIVSLALSAALCVGVGVGAGPALAEGPSKPVEGLVVRVDDDELIINVGLEQGLVAGGQIQILRRIEVRDPSSGKAIVDRFPIGTLKLVQVGRLLSIARKFQRLKPRPKVGDFVVFKPRPAPGTAPPKRAVTSPKAATRRPNGTARSPQDLERDSSFPVFKHTLGKPLRQRILIFERYLREHPESPHTLNVQREIEWLKVFMQASLAQSKRLATPAPPKKVVLTAKVSAPRKIEQGSPAEVYAVVVEHEEVTSARVLLRRGGTTKGYETHTMKRDGTFGWRAALGDKWRQAGEVDWVVEVKRTSGETEVISGGRRKLVVIERHTEKVSTENRSVARARFDWMSFWLEQSADQYYRLEADFRYTIDEGPLTAFRIGGGVIEGTGGHVDEIRETPSAATSRNATYGFAEVELEVHEYFGFAVRLTVGNNQPPASASRTIESLFGGGLTLRFGALGHTRLVADIELIEQIGEHYTLRMLIEEFPSFPMEVVILVTDAPVGADYGVSLQYAAGFRVHDLLALYARIGWNARRVDHSGITLGAGTVFTW